MKLRNIIGALLILLGQSSQACEDDQKKPDTVRLKKPKITVRGSLIKSLSGVQKQDLFRSLKESGVIIDMEDWEDIDIEEFEMSSIAPPATIPTVR